jgi:hypothetical protein
MTKLRLVRQLGQLPSYFLAWLYDNTPESIIILCFVIVASGIGYLGISSWPNFRQYSLNLRWKPKSISSAFDGLNNRKLRVTQ